MLRKEARLGIMTIFCILFGQSTCDSVYLATLEKEMGQEEQEEIIITNATIEFNFTANEQDSYIDHPCGYPGRPKYGYIKTDAYQHDKPFNMVVYVCLPQFMMMGNHVRYCFDNGLWSGTMPTCHRNLADGKVRLVESHVNEDSISQMVVDGDTESCTKSVKSYTPRWFSVDLGKIADVEAVNAVFNKLMLNQHLALTVYVMPTSQLSEANYHVCHRFVGTFREQKMTFLCEPGPMTGRFVYIRDNQRDAASFDLCEIIVLEAMYTVGCGIPEEPRYSQVTVDGLEAHYKCEEGYKLNKEPIRICTNRSQWIPAEAPVCKALDCGRPTVLENGTFKLRRNKTTYGYNATYSCKKDYRLEKPEKTTIQCQKTGEWEDYNFRCVKIENNTRPIMTVSEGNRTTNIGTYALYASSATVVTVTFCATIVMLCAKYQAKCKRFWQMRRNLREEIEMEDAAMATIPPCPAPSEEISTEDVVLDAPTTHEAHWVYNPTSSNASPYHITNPNILTLATTEIYQPDTVDINMQCQEVFYRLEYLRTPPMATASTHNLEPVHQPLHQASIIPRYVYAMIDP